MTKQPKGPFTAWIRSQSNYRGKVTVTESIRATLKGAENDLTRNSFGAQARWITNADGLVATPYSRGVPDYRQHCRMKGCMADALPADSGNRSLYCAEHRAADDARIAKRAAELEQEKRDRETRAALHYAAPYMRDALTKIALVADRGEFDTFDRFYLLNECRDIARAALAELDKEPA